MKATLLKYLNTEFIRFLVMGGVNTVLTYLLYLAFLIFFNYQVSYALSYVAGVILAYYLNSRFVFRTKMSVGKAVQYPVVYIVQYLLGVVLLYLLVELAGFSKELAPILVVILSIPVTFILSRFILK